MPVGNQTRHEILLPQVGHSGIELPLDCGEVDLHNFADFCGYEQSDTEVRLRWRDSKPNELFIRVAWGKKWTKEIIRKIEWMFEDGGIVIKAQRDSAMPIREDETLAEFRVLANEESVCTVEFSFHGGMVFEVSGSRQFALVS